MANAVTMGEIMLRLSTPDHQRFIQAESFNASYAGGEVNVAVSLANYGHDSEFITKLPDNQIGKSAAATIRKFNVKTEHIAYGGNRLGIYFLETGASIRSSSVIYDRADSSVSTADIEDFDFDEIFKGKDLFLFSGITPALSEKSALLTEAACKSAKSNGVTVACDYNYRQKLWTREKAASVMKPLMKYVDIFFGGMDDACGLLSRERTTDDTMETIFSELAEKFNFEYVFATHRESHSASDNTISAYSYSSADKALYSSKSYRICPIVDRVGGGDAFAGGVLCSILDKKDAKSAIEFGIAASALKHTISGDFNIVSRSEVEALAHGDGSWLVQR